MAEPSPRDDPDDMNKFKGFLDYDVTNDGVPLVENRESNLQEESTKINPELCDDGAAQEPQVKGSASCSAINEANKKTDASSSRNRDSSETGEIRRVDKEEDRNNGDAEHELKESDDGIDLDKKIHEKFEELARELGFSNCREEAVHREIQRDEETSRLITQPSHQNPRLNQIATSGHTMNPQQQISRPSRGSTSSTSDRNITSQLSAAAPPWNPPNKCQIPNRSDSEMSQAMIPPGKDAGPGSLVTQPAHQNPRVNHIARSGPTTNPQQQLRGPNHGSTSSASDRNNIRQPIRMQRQFPRSPRPWEPQNTGQQLPVANQFREPAILDHNYEPRGLQMMYPVANQQIHLYRHPVANQQNLYQHPVANHQNYYQHPMANQQIHLYRHPVANQQNLYQHPVANHQNYYQHPMPNQQNLYEHPMSNQQNYNTHPMPNQQNLYQHPMPNHHNLYQHPMVSPRMPQFWNPARGHARQIVAQAQQQTQSQGSNTRPSSVQGQDQQLPRLNDS